jgi:hypothetical protein
MKKKIPSIIVFLIGVSFFFVANYLNTSDEHPAIGGLTNLIFGFGGSVVLILSVIMFFNTGDDDDIEHG